jgi:hypothetical protein
MPRHSWTQVRKQTVGWWIQWRPNWCMGWQNTGHITNRPTKLSFSGTNGWDLLVTDPTNHTGNLALLLHSSAQLCTALHSCARRAKLILLLLAEMSASSKWKSDISYRVTEYDTATEFTVQIITNAPGIIAKKVDGKRFSNWAAVTRRDASVTSWQNIYWGMSASMTCMTALWNEHITITDSIPSYERSPKTSENL